MPKAAEEMVSSVKSNLKKKHPNWGKDRIDSTAYAIVQDHWKKKHGKTAF